MAPPQSLSGYLRGTTCIHTPSVFNLRYSQESSVNFGPNDLCGYLHMTFMLMSNYYNYYFIRPKQHGKWALYMNINFCYPWYIGKHISRFFDSIAIIILHSCMIALEPITTGMYPSASVTINRKFVCTVCMYSWSSSLLFVTSKSWILFPWSILLDSQWRFADISITWKGSRYCNWIKKKVSRYLILSCYHPSLTADINRCLANTKSNGHDVHTSVAKLILYVTLCFNTNAALRIQPIIL